MDFYCRTTGKVISTQLFIGVLCFSRYAFAEFKLSHDTLKSAVTKVLKYDPVIISTKICPFLECVLDLYSQSKIESQMFTLLHLCSNFENWR